MSKQELKDLYQSVHLFSSLSENEFVKNIANLLEDFALMNQDDLQRGKGFNLLMDLVKELKDE